MSEFNEFEPRLKSAKNRFQLSAGLKLKKLNTILVEPRLKFKSRLKFFKFGLRIHSLKYLGFLKSHPLFKPLYINIKIHNFYLKCIFKTTSLWFLGETRGTSGTRSRTIHQVLSNGGVEVPWLKSREFITIFYSYSFGYIF